MPKICLKTDTVSGGQFETSWGEENSFTVGGIGTICLGDKILPHYPFTGPHLNATMIAASGNLVINGKHSCVDGDSASCGCVVIGSGKIIT